MKELTKEEYIDIKRKAYELASTLSKEEIEGLIEFINARSIRKTGEKEIFISTLMYPNDIDLIYAREEKHIHDLKGLEKETLIPNDIILTKLVEYGRFNTMEILTSNKELRTYAEQASQFDGRYERKK